MPVFAYTALDAANKKVRGTLRADSGRHARRQLLAEGKRPTHLAESAEAVTGGGWRAAVARALQKVAARRRRERMLEALENVITLLESGVALEEAWATVAETGSRQDPAARVLLGVSDQVRAGEPLSRAMGAYRDWFDEIDVALVRAGEDAGELPAVLTRLVARRRLASKLTTLLIGALAYPAFLAVVGAGVVIFLTASVIPNLNAMIVSAGGEVPVLTRALVAVGRALAYGALPVAALAVVGGAWAARRFPALGAGARRALGRVPVLGPGLLQWQLAQFCTVLKTLVASGVHLPESLSLAARASGSGEVGRAAVLLRERVLEGHDLAPTGGAEHRAIPPWLWRALEVGQKTGDLVPVLERVSQRLEESTARAVARVAAVLEPIMILFIGAVIGVVAYAALLPIVKLGAAW